MRVLAPFLISVLVVVVGGLILNGILSARWTRPPETPQDGEKWRQR